MNIRIKLTKHYRYGIVRGRAGNRTGWLIVRQRCTPLLRLRYGKIEKIDHLFWDRNAAIDALNKLRNEGRI